MTMLDMHDVEEIRGLMFTYAQYVDERDHAALGRMFAKGRIRSDRGETGPGLVGADAVRAAYDRNNKVMPDGSTGTRHLITNIRIPTRTPRTEPVVVRSCFAVFQATPRLPLQPIVMGRYSDRFVLDAEGWRFDEKFIHVDLLGNLAEHLNIEL